MRRQKSTRSAAVDEGKKKRSSKRRDPSVPSVKGYEEDNASSDDYDSGISRPSWPATPATLPTVPAGHPKRT